MSGCINVNAKNLLLELRPPSHFRPLWLNAPLSHSFDNNLIVAILCEPKQETTMKNQLGYTLKELLIVIFFFAVALSIFIAGIAAFIWLVTNFS